MENYKFPDEVENEAVEKESKGLPVDTDEEFQIEIEDDTPPQDKGRKPSQPEFVEQLEKDELDEYSAEAKKKIDGFRKIYHDERRAKEAASREREEAIRVAQQLLEENKKLKKAYSSGEQEYINTVKNATELELDVAKRGYKEALETGDSDRIVEAQSKLNAASIKADRVNNFRPSALQEQENEVQIPQQSEKTVVRDQKASSWQERNSWFGQDDEMTSLALGLHEKLVKANGMAYATTDEYYKRIDETMRKRFPENFEEVKEEKSSSRTKPSTVVAPASRSTSSKKIVLSSSQQNIAKKLGLTNEQYATAVMKMDT
jgi:predicted DNA binding CopG/RHH family protein